MRLWIRFAVGILLCANAFAQDSLGVRKIGDFGDWFHYANDLVVVDSFMYVLTHDDGLQVYRLEHFEEPHFIGRNMTLSGTRFKLFDDRLIIWQSTTTIRLVDMSDVTHTRQASAITCPATIKDVCIVGDKLYLIRHGFGIETYSIASNDQLERIGEFETPAVLQSVACTPGYLVTTSTDSLRILDIADPSSPFVAGAVTLNGNAGQILVIGQMAYIDRGSGIDICDLSEPTAPEIVGSVTVLTGGSIITMANADGNLLFELGHPDNWGGYYSYLRIFDLSIPDSPQQIWSMYFTEENVRASADRGYFAVLAYSFPKFRIFDSSDENAIFQTYVRENYYYAINEVAVENGLAVTSRGSLGLSLYDVSEPGDPHFLYGSSVWEETEGVTISQNLVGTGDAICGPIALLDIENPADPIVLPTWLGCGSCYDIYDYHMYQVRSFAPHLLRRFDISDFSNPFMDATTPLYFRASAMEVRDSLAYIATSNGLSVVDVSGADTMIVVGNLELTGALSHISVDDNVAVLQSSTSSFYIVDVTDPTSPQTISEYFVSGTIHSIELKGNFVFSASDLGGLRVYDISDPHNPIEIGHYASGHRAVDVDIEGRYAYLANTGQVFVLDVGACIGGGIPAAPQEVKIGRTIDPDHYLLTWLPVTTDRIGDPIAIDAYEIYRRNSASGVWENIGVPSPPTATQFTIDIPISGAAFAEYQVRAVKW